MKDLVNFLNGLLDQHASPIRVGRTESHDEESLSKRTCTPVEALQALLAVEFFAPISPVHRDSKNGIMSWRSDDLNAVKRFVLQSIVEKVIEESEGDENEISIAASHALKTHVARFAKAGKKEFSRSMNGAMMFGSKDDGEERPGIFTRTATGVAKIGAIGGLGYAGAAYARGRGLAGPGKGLLPTLKVGAMANNRTLRRGVIGGSRGLDKILVALGNRKI